MSDSHALEALAAERARLDALHSLAVLDTPPESSFDELTKLASRICRTPIALVSLVDLDRQWFKSRVGLDATETPRDVAFCHHAIQTPTEPFVIPNALEDPRFQDNPLVTGTPNIRMYAGVPLLTPEGQAVGTLCVIDRVPRGLSEEELDTLRILARQAATQLALRRHLRELEANRLDLVEYQDRLERSNEELDRFAHIVGHDLKAPLHGISGYAELLVSNYGDGFDEEGRSMLRELPQLCGQLSSFLDSLLEYSSAKKIDLAVQPTPLDDVLDQILSSLGPLLHQHGAEVVRHPLPVVQCDFVRFGEVFRNFVTNALKYNEEPVPRIEIGTRSVQDGLATIYVADNGIGIAEADRARVFDMFQRLHAPTAYGGGNGSGLAIVQTIVERHGGRIDVESTPGEGTTFLVTLPGAEELPSAA